MRMSASPRSESGGIVNAAYSRLVHGGGVADGGEEPGVTFVAFDDEAFAAFEAALCP